MRWLTDHQRNILRFIVKFQKEHGFSPSIRDIAGNFGLRSPRTVRDYLSSLERKGYIRVHPKKSRAIEVIKDPFSGIPIIGEIAAGDPIAAIEKTEEAIDIDPKLFTTEPCFALRVKGDSMEGAHICDGDYAIIKRQSYAEDGDIVCVVIGDDITLKRFRKKGKKIEFCPENPKYRPIAFDKNFPPTILGILVGLIRRV